MAQMIIDGLRPQHRHSAGPHLQDTGNDADVEGDHSGPKPRKRGRPNRRDPTENELSVSVSPLPFQPKSLS